MAYTRMYSLFWSYGSCAITSVEYSLASDAQKMAALEREERQIKEENIRLQRRLLLEQERRENLGRQLSESESSLEMEDERYLGNSYSTSDKHSNSSTKEISVIQKMHEPPDMP